MLKARLEPMLGPRLIELATATGLLLPRQTRLVGAMLDEIDRLDARRTALERATAILDAGQGLSRWALAQRLESALARFAAVGMKRVESGHRAPTELELHLMTLLAGPRCRSKLWLEIRGNSIGDFIKRYAGRLEIGACFESAGSPITRRCGRSRSSIKIVSKNFWTR